MKKERKRRRMMLSTHRHRFVAAAALLPAITFMPLLAIVDAQQQQQTTPATAKSIKLSNYTSTSTTTYPNPGTNNPSAQLCPGHESKNMHGYTTLASLQSDIRGYMNSLTSSPTNSEAPTPSPSGSPTLDPTKNPSEEPTPAPSLLPTKAPITLRPTPAPTSGIRNPKKPTFSPAPTIEVVIVGGGGGGPTTNQGPTRRIMLEEESMMMSGGVAPPVMSPAVNKRLRGHHHESSLADEEEGMMIVQSEGEMVIRDGSDPVIITGDDMEVIGDFSFSVFDDSTDPPSSYPADRSSSFESLQSSEPRMDDFDISNLLDNEELLVSFNICPNTSFAFTNQTILDQILAADETAFDNGTSTMLNDMNETVSWSFDPLELDSPLMNDISIHCIDDHDDTTSCVFEGGSVHVLVTNEAYDEDDDDTDPSHSSSLSISGVTFQGASHASVLMQDPHSNVDFVSCEWKYNTGYAIWVDGRWIKPTMPWTSTTTSSTEWVAGSSTSSTGFDFRGRDLEDEEEESEMDSGMFEIDEEPNGDEELNGDRDFLLLDSISHRKAQDNAMGEDETDTMTTSSTASMFSTSAADKEEEDEDSTPIIAPPTEPATAATMPGTGATNPAVPIIYDSAGPPENTGEDDDEDGGVVFVTTSEGGGDRGIETNNVTEEVDDGFRSVVSVERCTFRGNTGNATIMVTSYSGDEVDLLNSERRYLSPNASISHTINLKLKKTAFTLENVDAVIFNSGSRFQSTGCTFANNTAVTIIKAEKATMVVLRSEFRDNQVTGDGGVIVLDSESEVERNEGNCAVDDVVVEADQNRELQAAACDGILASDGTCQAFDDNCVNTGVDFVSYSPTTSPPSVIPTYNPKTPPGVAETYSPAPTISPKSPTGPSKPNKPNKPGTRTCSYPSGSTKCNDCARGYFCKLDMGVCPKNKGEQRGKCERVSSRNTCSDTRDPVCGCDGKRYTNDCMAFNTGINIRNEGSCRVDNDNPTPPSPKPPTPPTPPTLEETGEGCRKDDGTPRKRWRKKCKDTEKEDESSKIKPNKKKQKKKKQDKLSSKPGPMPSSPSMPVFFTPSGKSSKARRERQ